MTTRVAIRSPSQPPSVRDRVPATLSPYDVNKSQPRP
jgi:hypothetical protein